MWILQNASKLTFGQRKLISMFVVAFVLTNVPLSAIHAAEVVTASVPPVPTQGVRIAPLLGRVLPASKDKTFPALRTLRMTVTAYNSTPNQTDASPYVTASGSCVHDGVVASNVLRIGTRIRLPELFDSTIFVVEDRMNERYAHRVDVWMSDGGAARQFGLQRNVTVEVVSEGDGKKHWDEGWTNEECAAAING